MDAKGPLEVEHLGGECDQAEFLGAQPITALDQLGHPLYKPGEIGILAYPGAALDDYLRAPTPPSHRHVQEELSE